MGNELSTAIEEREAELQARGRELREAFDAIQQPRSDFALAHFVVAQHDTPARQWAQAVLELQIKVFTLRRTQLAVDRLEERIAAADAVARNPLVRGRRRRLAAIEAAELRVDREETAQARLGAVREAETLYAIARQIEAKANDGRPFTYEQLQAGEIEYWQLRLGRQAYLAARKAIDQGNGEALLQAMTTPGETRPQLLSGHDVQVMLGVHPEQEAARLEDERRAIDLRLAVVRPETPEQAITRLERERAGIEYQIDKARQEAVGVLRAPAARGGG
jgi:hypothetical protein